MITTHLPQNGFKVAIREISSKNWGFIWIPIFNGEVLFGGRQTEEGFNSKEAAESRKKEFLEEEQKKKQYPLRIEEE
jgi:hypothetical protein